MRNRVGSFLVTLLVLPGIALAQDSAITGGVSDGTGGVLPGVTVEVASPVMIEGSRVAITDGQGRFAVTRCDLGPTVFRLRCLDFPRS